LRLREGMTSSPSLGPKESDRLLTAELVFGLLAAAGALILLAWLGREVLLGVTLSVDGAVRAAVHQFASPGLTSIMIAVSLFGGPSVLTPIGVVLALAFLARRWHRGAVLVVVTMAGAGLLDTMLKHAFGRVRPAPFFDYPLPVSNSFPSGHAFFAASFFGGLAVLVSGRVRSRPLRIGVWILAVLIMVLVGFSRVYLGVHYPSDVLAGYAGATVWITAVAVGDRLVSRRRQRMMA
jgi:undecaprenyl-diphosphatase